MPRINKFGTLDWKLHTLDRVNLNEFGHRATFGKAAKDCTEEEKALVGLNTITALLFSEAKAVQYRDSTVIDLILRLDRPIRIDEQLLQLHGSGAWQCVKLCGGKDSGVLSYPWQHEESCDYSEGILPDCIIPPLLINAFQAVRRKDWSVGLELQAALPSVINVELTLWADGGVVIKNPSDFLFVLCRRLNRKIWQLSRE